MFKYRISADENADVDGLADDLRNRLEQVALAPEKRALALAETKSVLREFVNNGRRLAALGSHFNAARDIRGDGYSIKVAFSPSSAKGWVARLLGR